MDICLPYQWAPRPHQTKLWEYLKGGGTRAVALWPRRHGKDDVFLRHTSCRMPIRKGNYWYLLPEYAQARKSMWDAINEETGIRRIDEAFPREIRTVYREQEMILGYAGSTFQLVGADNFKALVGSPPIGLVFSEYARTNPSAWPYLMPIMEKNGGWVGFNSTPFGNNHYKRLCAFAEKKMLAGFDWFFEKLTADDCAVFSPGQLQDILEQLQDTHGEDYGKSLWLQEYFCSFDAAIPGSIWGDCVTKAELSGRILDFEHSHTNPVHTAWDLGRTDDTAIWFYQFNGPWLDILDHHSSSLKDIPFYMDLLEAKRMEHGITYARQHLPHDARPRTLAAGGKSIWQQCHDAAKKNPALGTFQIGKRLDKQEHIQAGRATFPHVRLHKTRCAKGIESLRHYHREYDEEKKVFKDAPEHDWSSHDADAFMELATSWKRADVKQPDSPLIDKMLAHNPGAQTFGQLRERLFRQKRQQREARC